MDHDERVHRDLSAHLSLDVTSPATLAFELAVSTQVAAQESLVKIDPKVPLEIAALFGCAILTGVGAVTNTAKVAPGQPVAVVRQVTGSSGLVSTTETVRVCARLTLVTCYPFSMVGPAPSRFVVVADRVDAAARVQAALWTVLAAGP